VAAVALSVVFLTNDDSSAPVRRAGGRPPAAAPQGTRVISQGRVGIAAPEGWVVSTDPGESFDQLDQDEWGTPLVATRNGGSEGLLVVPLRPVEHDPLADPDLFWSDQVVDPGTGRTISDTTSMGVHGFRANRVVIGDRAGTGLVAAAVETGRGVYLVAFRAPDAVTAMDRFQRLIQTFDVR
jgi:hypothetical protein